MFIERKIDSSTHAVELWKAEWENRKAAPVPHHLARRPAARRQEGE
jgi:hypothetical protein